jgi:hypothetical protein
MLSWVVNASSTSATKVVPASYPVMVGGGRLKTASKGVIFVEV